ncbi:MAG: hypothetical protein ACPGQO_04295 [Candidatus Poseidoniaceae archaeon]
MSYDPDGWGTPLLLIVLGLSLITFPFYVRVRVHMRMSDEAFARVPRGALWAQSIGIWNLVFLGFILLIFVQDHPDSERYATMSVILGIVILHLMARLLQSIALGSRWRRLQRGQRWQPAPVTQYILAYPAVFVPGAGQPIAPPVVAPPTVEGRGLNAGLDPLPPVQAGSAPASFQQVLDAVHRQVAEANARAAALEEELSETRRHVTRLEHDLVERRAEIVLLEAAQTRFEGDMERQASREDGKGLSMQDSVVAGDAFVGSTVIDRQIVNDPEAIARAVLEAYRSGRSEA